MQSLYSLFLATFPPIAFSACFALLLPLLTSLSFVFSRYHYLTTGSNPIATCIILQQALDRGCEGLGDTLGSNDIQQTEPSFRLISEGYTWPRSPYI